MKKLVIFLLLAVTLALAAAPMALAETDQEARICQLAKQCDKVTDAKCLVYERTAIVAVKTEKFNTKSQYDAFVKSLCASVKSECQVDRVFVTRNPKVMRQIEELSQMDEDARQEAIDQLIDELTRLRPIRKIHFPDPTFAR